MRRLLLIVSADERENANAVLAAVGAAVSAPLSADGSTPATHYGASMRVSSADYARLTDYSKQNYLGSFGTVADGQMTKFADLCETVGVRPITERKSE